MRRALKGAGPCESHPQAHPPQIGFRSLASCRAKTGSRHRDQTAGWKRELSFWSFGLTIRPFGQEIQCAELARFRHFDGHPCGHTRIFGHTASTLEVPSLDEPARMVLAFRTPVPLPRAFALADFVRVHMNPAGHLTVIAPASGAHPVEFVVLRRQHLSIRSHA